MRHKHTVNIVTFLLKVMTNLDLTNQSVKEFINQAENLRTRSPENSCVKNPVIKYLEAHIRKIESMEDVIDFL